MADNTKIIQNLFTRAMYSAMLVDKDSEKRMILLYQNPLFSTPQMREYVSKKFKALKNIEHPQFIDIAPGVYNNFPFISFPDVFGNSRYQTLDALFKQIRDKKDFSIKLIRGLVLLMEKFHNENLIMGNACPSLFLVQEAEILFYLDILNGWENASIYKKTAIQYKEEKNFISPEHILERPIGKGSDIFSLALSIIYLFTEKTFTHDNIKSNEIDIPDVLNDYREILVRMTDPDIGKRPGIELVQSAFSTSKLPVKFTYYDLNKVADDSCARCNQPVQDADCEKVGNEYFCKECIQELSTVIEAKVEQKGIENCKFHRQRSSVHNCSNCTVPICEDCTAEVDGYFYCPECAYEQRKKLERETAQKLQQEYRMQKEEQSRIIQKRKDEKERKERGEDIEIFDDSSFTITEDLSHSNIIVEKKKNKIPLFIILGASLIILLTLFLIIFGRQKPESRELAKLKKQYTKETVLSRKLPIGFRIAAEYYKNEEDEQRLEKSMAFLDEMLLITKKDGLSQKDIYFRQIDYLLEHKKISDVIIIFENMKNQFRTDEIILPSVLFSEAEFYESLKNSKKALELYRDIQNKYGKTTYGIEAAKAVRRLSGKK